MFMLCTEGEGRSKSLIVSSESHRGRLRFFSLSLCFIHVCRRYVIFFFSFLFFIDYDREREREADTNFRIKIFEPYCFAYIFRFAISSGARLLYTKKQDVPGRMTQQVILRNGETRKLRGFSEWSFSCVTMGHGNGKRQTLEGAIN